MLEVSWEKEVVQAVEEVHNSMYALSEHQKAVKASAKAVKSFQNVLSLAQKGFAEGTVPFLQIFDAERSALNSENAYALDRRNLAIDYVQLNIALGGRFDSPRVTEE